MLKDRYRYCRVAGASDDNAQKGAKGLENRKWWKTQNKIHKMHKYV